MRKALFFTLFLVMAFGGAQTALAEGPEPAHFDLSKSEPGAKANVESPTEVRLWFTQVPQENTTTIRVIPAGGEPLHTGEVVRDSSDGSISSVALHHPPEPGTYQVSWRAMGTDGHVVKGDFTFTVSGN
jgi:methionine-rich copper-binding protein CopC